MPLPKLSFLDLVKAGHPDKVKAWLTKHPLPADRPQLLNLALCEVVIGGSDTGPDMLEVLLAHATKDQASEALNNAVFHAWRGSWKASAISMTMVEVLLRSPLLPPAALFETMLHNAISGGHPQAVERLLPHFLPVKAVTLVNAAENKHNTVAILDLLLSHPHADLKDCASWPLCAAARKGNSPAIRHLLDKSDADAAAKAIADVAQQQQVMMEVQGKVQEPARNSEWVALECLALEVSVTKAKGWVTQYGAAHFPRWEARQREVRAKEGLPSAHPQRSRSRP